jgi:ABC-type branched-subunit amino acid transport system permease subunit
LTPCFIAKRTIQDDLPGGSGANADPAGPDRSCGILLIAFVAIPAFRQRLLSDSIMIPFLVFSLAAIGLNVLTGFCGQLSLGTGAFMGVGAYACLQADDHLS